MFKSNPMLSDVVQPAYSLAKRARKSGHRLEAYIVGFHNMGQEEFVIHRGRLDVPRLKEVPA
eukprot:7646649-Lingulodinium_polyedra.AAC.1